SGADIVFVTPDLIASTMDAAMNDYKKQGLNPYYIWGGGHTLDGGLAYIEAVGELKRYCDREAWYPEYIFHASGTGSTQAGIMAGLDKYGIDEEVIGISVARTKPRAEEVVKAFYEELCSNYQIAKQERSVTVLDDFLY